MAWYDFHCELYC